ncbi:MAG: hypothetical protein E4G95_01525 [Bacteroidia bacterium]|nr:MAG: hypothetical protein E4G95_01525 [Bacteroidia bacterium]
MKNIIYLFILALFTAFAWSCYYDNEEWIYPELGTECDTVTVTFTATIKPILSNNCYSCHSNSTAPSYGNNIRLEDYADVVAASTTVRGSINHAGGYSPMPKNGGKLGYCQLKQFDVWINRGMPEN